MSGHEQDHFPPEWLQPAVKNPEDSHQAMQRPYVSYWQDAWQRLRRNKLAMLGLVFLLALIGMALFAPCSPLIPPPPRTSETKTCHLQPCIGLAPMTWVETSSPGPGKVPGSHCLSDSWRP